jgi:hypothetical protein
VALPYLRHGGTRRFVHLGHGFDQAAKAPIEEGWEVLSLDANGKPTAGPSADGPAAAIEAAGFNDVELVVIDAGGNDFALLGQLNFGALTPGLIMTAFNPALPGQDPATAGTILLGMRLNGYRAAVFSFGLDAATRQPRLAGLSLDHVPDRPFSGIILFFRTTDEAFLPSLLGWLEDEGAAAPMPGSLAAE